MDETTYDRSDAPIGSLNRSATHDHPPPGPPVLADDFPFRAGDEVKRNGISARSGGTKRGSGSGRQREAFGRVREYVYAHLDSKLAVDALAQVVGMSTSQFSRTFHKAVGLSPHTYVIQCRVTRAQELLVTTRLPLTEIALAVGFADQSHFSRRFRQLIGVPPLQFRMLAGRFPR